MNFDSNRNGEEMNDSKNAAGEVPGEEIFLKKLISYAAKTPLFREIISSLIPEILDIWAGSGRVKKAAANSLKKSIMGAFEKNGTAPPEKDFTELNELATVFIPLINRLARSGTEIIGQAASLNPEEKTRLAENIFHNIKSGDRGRALTSLLKIINDIHGVNPKFFSEQMRSSAGSLIKNTDFGELLETVENSREDVISFVQAAGEELWQYPAKAVCIFALVPELLNISMSVFSEVLKPVNNMSPDLLTDVVLSLLRSCDGRAAGEMINQSAEIVRKVHTGSALLGDMGSPALPLEAGRFLDEILDGADIPLILKSVSLLDEIREQADERLQESMSGNPDIVKEILRRKFRQRGASVRKWSRTLDLMEDLFSDEELAEELDLGLRETDPQEAAQSISNFAAMMNRVLEINPDILKNTVIQITDTLDPSALDEFAGHMAAALKPAALTVLPRFIRTFTELCTPDEKSDNYEEMNDALCGLRALILGNGGLK